MNLHFKLSQGTKNQRKMSIYYVRDWKNNLSKFRN